MVRAVGGVWAQRVPSLWITSAARRLVDEHPGDEALARRLAPYIDRDRRMLVEDIERGRPDAILVGRLDTRFHQWAWSDPAIAAARADYRFFAAEPDKDFPAELCVRKDLIGLRATPARRRRGRRGGEVALRRRGRAWTRRPGTRMNSPIESRQTAREAE